MLGRIYHDARSIGCDLFHPESKATETRVLPELALWTWYVSPLMEALALAAVGRDYPRLRGVRLDRVVVGEPLGQLAGLRVPHPDPVADGEPVRPSPADRRLYLAGALGSGQPHSRRARRHRQPVRCPRSRREVPAAVQGDRARPRPPDHGQGIEQRGPRPDPPV